MQIDTCRSHEVALHLLGLALAEQAMVDEHTGELVSDCALHQRCGDRGVHPTRQAADRPTRTDPLADERNLLLHDAAHRPRLPAAGDVDEEALQDLLAVFGVQHLGMPLDSGYPPLGRLECRHRRARR